MEIRVEETKKYLKVEKLAKKELLIRIIIFSSILLYIFFKLYKLSSICIIIFPILLGFEYAFIIKYLYEVIIINNKKIVVYVSLFYRHLKFCKLFNSLQVYDIDNLKNIYFKNTTEILVSKAIKRTESPYHKIHLTFKDRGYNFRRANEMKISTSEDEESSHGAGFSVGGGINLERFHLNVAYGKYHVSSSSLMLNVSYRL